MRTTLKQAYAVTTAVAVFVAITATSAFGSAGGSIVGEGASFGHRPRQISPASAFVLPSAKQCVGGHELTIELRTLPHVRWVEATIDVNGARFKTIKRSQLTRPVTLTGLPSGRFALSITARTSDGRGVTTTRSYSACAPPPPPPPPCGDCLPVPPLPVPPVTPVVPVTPVTPVTPEEPVTPSAVLPGSYSGSYLTFDVSPDSSHIQDVSKNYVTLSCTSGATLTGQTIVINEIPITSPGSFTASETEQGWISGHAVKIVSTFAGDVESSAATGSYSQRVVYEDGSGVTCSSGTVAWTASYDSQGNQAAATPVAGSYNGSYLAFDVSPDGSHIQDVSKNYVTLYCSSGATLTGQTIVINEIPITGLTTFTKTESEKGWSTPSGEEITTSATITGHFHGLTSGGEQRVSGSYVEEVAYEKGERCTSDAVAWTASYDSQGNQAAATPVAGSYNGSYLAFDVSPDGSHIQDVSKNYVTLYCSSGATLTGQTIVINEIPITGLTTFTKTESEKGWSTPSGEEITTSATITGHFHGLTSGGEQRVSGSYVEEVAYEKGERCTSDAVAWTASYDSQGNQAAATPVAGSYNGSYLKFTVPSGGASIENVSKEYVTLYCSSGTTLTGQTITIGSIPVVGLLSFEEKQTEKSVIGGKTVTITSTFSGHFHGLNTSNEQRVSGSFIQEVQYEGSDVKCSSGAVAWTALS